MKVLERITQKIDRIDLRLEALEFCTSKKRDVKRKEKLAARPVSVQVPLVNQEEVKLTDGNGAEVSRTESENSGNGVEVEASDLLIIVNDQPQQELQEVEVHEEY